MPNSQLTDVVAVAVLITCTAIGIALIAGG
jgi:hypothetical protein